MVKRGVGVFFIVCTLVLLSSCTIRRVNPEPSSLFMTWLIDQAEQRVTQAFPEEQFWGLWDVMGVVEGFEAEVFEDTSDRGKTFAEIDRWEFRFAFGEIFGQKTGVIQWIDGEWQEPNMVDDQVMEECILDHSTLDEIRYDLDQAIMMLRTSGYAGDADWFSHVYLVRPLVMAPGEPYYVFKISPGVFIAIGSHSGSIEDWS